MDTWTSKDKVLHYIVGFVITFLFGIHTQDLNTSTFAGILVAGVKEVLDKVSYGKWSYKDFVITLLGVGTAFSCLKFFVL